jgi:hypothetical protein
LTRGLPIGVEVPAHRTGTVPTTAVDRQARHRAKQRLSHDAHAAASAPRSRRDRNVGPPPLPRWSRGKTNTAPGSRGYRKTWRLDLDELLSIDPPRGYGRD